MKRCPCCNTLISGRTDKIFCDDKCRNNFYYKVNAEHKAFIRVVNKKLLLNRGILRAVNPSGRTSVLKSYLDAEGFDYNYYTGIHTTKKGRPYYLVYEQAYSLNDDGETVSLVVFYRDTQTVVCEEHV